LVIHVVSLETPEFYLPPNNQYEYYEKRDDEAQVSYERDEWNDAQREQDEHGSGSRSQEACIAAGAIYLTLKFCRGRGRLRINRR